MLRVKKLLNIGKVLSLIEHTCMILAGVALSFVHESQMTWSFLSSRTNPLLTHFHSYIDVMAFHPKDTPSSTKFFVPLGLEENKAFIMFLS